MLVIAPWRSAPARAEPASSPPFSIDLLERVDRHLPFGDHALELGVLGLEFAKPLDVRGLHLAELRAPTVQRLFADLVLARYLGDRSTVGLAQYRNHLFFGEPALSHGLLAGSGGHSLKLPMRRKSRAGQDDLGESPLKGVRAYS